MNESNVKLLSGYAIVENLAEEVTTNIVNIGAADLWKYGYTGKGVVVAILDTGCNSHHLDLNDRIIAGHNFTNDFQGDATIYDDLNGHGTHVAGIIAASLNHFGIVGVAPDVSLLILKVLDAQGNGSINSVVKAIDYAVNWKGPNNESVDIISMSLGVATLNENLHLAVKNAISANIAVVVAAGNEGDGSLNTDEYSYPAGFDEVIAVGAVNKNNEVEKFTNSNKEVDLYAPGVDIRSTYINDEFIELSGTSMAAPHVTGALALLINKYESLTKAKPTESQLFNYLMKHTTKVFLADYGQTINILDLTKNVSETEDETINKTLLLKCFCEARKSQSFFTQCLTDSSTEKERAFLISLVQESASRANQIKYLCQEFK